MEVGRRAGEKWMWCGKKGVTGGGNLPLESKGLMFMCDLEFQRASPRQEVRKVDGHILECPECEEGAACIVLVAGNGVDFWIPSRILTSLKILYAHIFVYTVWHNLEVTAYQKVYSIKINNNLTSLPLSGLGFQTRQNRWTPGAKYRHGHFRIFYFSGLRACSVVGYIN